MDTTIMFPKNKFKENMLRKINPLTNSTQDTQRKFGKVVSKKSVFISSKDKTMTPETMNQVTSLSTMASLPIVDYNIINDTKKVHANI